MKTLILCLALIVAMALAGYSRTVRIPVAVPVRGVLVSSAESGCIEALNRATATSASYRHKVKGEKVTTYRAVLRPIAASDEEAQKSCIAALVVVGPSNAKYRKLSEHRAAP